MLVVGFCFVERAYMDANSETTSTSSNENLDTKYNVLLFVESAEILQINLVSRLLKQLNLSHQIQIEEQTESDTNDG